jgi:DNA polymerase III subunit gamma/tau
MSTNAGALITKYRPETFEEVIGQDAVVKSLRNAIENKLGTAYLFTGPSGVGKTTLAYIAAQMLGCAKADLLDVDAATNTGIEEMRVLMEGLMYRPIGSGAVKAVIIDEAHALSKAAITSLLKTLEAPPPWVYWFLCTTEPTKIPKAIQTRCLSYQLRDVRADDLFDLLKGTDEGKDLDEDILNLCVDEASGSPRQALANLGVCMMAEDRDEAAELLRSAVNVPEAIDLARALMRGAGWGELRELLAKMKEKDLSPESVRHVVRAYMTSVLLSPKTRGDGTKDALDILREFSTPFNSSDGLTPLAVACGRLSGQT